MIITKDFNFGNSKEFILPEDLGKRCAYALLDEVYYGGCVDSTNQQTALLLMSLTQGDNISSLKVGGRVTQQSVAMVRNIKKFWNLEFKVEECEDEVFDSDSDE